MKPRARYTPRLNTWIFWGSDDDWLNRTVGFGYSIEQAFDDWVNQLWGRK